MRVILNIKENEIFLLHCSMQTDAHLVNLKMYVYIIHISLYIVNFFANVEEMSDTDTSKVKHHCYY